MMASNVIVVIAISRARAIRTQKNCRTCSFDIFTISVWTKNNPHCDVILARDGRRYSSVFWRAASNDDQQSKTIDGVVAFYASINLAALQFSPLSYILATHHVLRLALVIISSFATSSARNFKQKTAAILSIKGTSCRKSISFDGTNSSRLSRTSL